MSLPLKFANNAKYRATVVYAPFKTYSLVLIKWDEDYYCKINPYQASVTPRSSGPEMFRP